MRYQKKSERAKHMRDMLKRLYDEIVLSCGSDGDETILDKYVEECEDMTSGKWDSVLWKYVPPVDRDGVTIAIGDHVYTEDYVKWRVIGYCLIGCHNILARNSKKDEKRLRAEWLTHEAPSPYQLAVQTARELGVECNKENDAKLASLVDRIKNAVYAEIDD